MNSNPLISVSMACYNSELFVKQAIKSIYIQNYKNWEIIIVDDKSKDKSIDIINNTIDKYNIEDKVKLIKNDENKGYGYTLNKAIKHSKGELVSIVDSDDALYNENAFDVMIDYHIKYPEASLVYSDYYECNKHLKIRKIITSRQLKDNETYLGNKIKISHLKVFKKEFYNKSEGVNPDLKKSVDKNLILILERYGKLIYCPEVLYLYRQHRNNLTNGFNKNKNNIGYNRDKMRKKMYENEKKKRGII